MTDKQDIKPWVQPLFLVYDGTVDEKVPLTQARLDRFIENEQRYIQMISAIKQLVND